MRITIIGSGYVGLVAGACFAQMGNDVICLDIDSKKIQSLAKGVVPLYEPGLEAMIRENLRLKTITFMADKKAALSRAEVVFIAVGTPMGEDGSADLQYVKAVAKDIGQCIESDYVVVVNKSTVPIGTADIVRRIISAELDGREFAVESEGLLGADLAGGMLGAAPDGWVQGLRSGDSNLMSGIKGRGLESKIDSQNDDFLESSFLDSQDSTNHKNKGFLESKNTNDLLHHTSLLSPTHHPFKDEPSIPPSTLMGGIKGRGLESKIECDEFVESKNKNVETKDSKKSNNFLESQSLLSPTHRFIIKTQKPTFDVISNPEFLKEGVAIKDFLSPDRVIIGTDSARALEIMRRLYAPFLVKSDRLIAMSVASAEMTKYAANAMLATKISFINEISQICERVGANVNDVRLGIGADTRIGYSFIYPGCGYGGSCFPKDVRALEKTALDFGYKARILNAVQTVNQAQKMLLAEKILRHFYKKGVDKKVELESIKFGHYLKELASYAIKKQPCPEGFMPLKNKIFAVWGLSFKPETDDMREASSIVLIENLVYLGASIRAYDSKAMEQARFYFREILDSVTLCESKYEALKSADALCIVTEWREFRSPDFDEIKKLLKEPVIFDGRNIYQHQNLESKGFTYYQIGVG